MGKLGDELKKWIAKGGRPVEGVNKAGAITVAAAKADSSQSILDWKRGVVPMKAGQLTANTGLSIRSSVTASSRSVGLLKDASESVPPVKQVTGRRALAAAPGAKAQQPQPERSASSKSQVDQTESTFSVLRFGSAKQPLLSRPHEFKLPEDWISAGAKLQPPQGSRGRILPVRIGIDFGTAYTKVAIRAGDRVFFIPWTGLRNSQVHYLLPGELSRLENDSLWLGRCSASTEVRSDLKLPFLSDQSSTPAQQAAAMAFLASVIRYARAWLYHAQAALVSGRTLAWELNIGCPTNSWSSGSVRRVYERIAARAWQLSQAKQGIDWAGAVVLLAPLDVSYEDLGLDGLNLVPEFIAQIAGYVRSPQRKNGLHMLMDVGAGTVDLATFNVFYDDVKEEDRYPIFASNVLPLGTHFLMAMRLRKCESEDDEWDDLQAIPGDEELAKRLNASVDRVKVADEEFATQLGVEIKRVLSYTRVRRYGRAPEWREGLPVFLSGGGADCGIYSRVIASACVACKVPYRRTSFPLLDEAAAGGSFPASEFHRLSVAYGLTFDAQSVGRILAPHEVDDAPAYDPLVDVPRERPDRDELYPK